MEDGTRSVVGWRSLAEAVPGGVAVQRGDRFVYLSPTAGTLLDVDPESATNEPWERPFADADRDRLGRGIDAARADGHWDGIVSTSPNFGASHHVEVDISQAEDGVLVWTLTECEDAPPATDDHDRGSPDAEATLLDDVADAVYALDADLRFTYVNDAARDVFGRSRAELLGTSVETMFEDADEKAFAARMRERALDTEGDDGMVRATVPTPAGERTLESHYRVRSGPNGEFAGSVGVVRDVTAVDRLHRELHEEDRLLQNVIDALDDVVYVIDEDENFVYWNEVAVERTGYTDEEFEDLHPMAFAVGQNVDQSYVDQFDIEELPDRYTLDLVTKDGETIPHDLHGVTYRDEETGELYLVGVARDISERLERERELERQRDELATLDRINELVLETVKELLTTANRDAVERSVCDRLASSDLYQFAWIGEPELDGDRIVPRVIAGDESGYLDDVTITDDDSEHGSGPIGRAIRTGEPRSANVDDAAFEPWREQARDRGVESVLAVPLRHGQTVYGVLAVYATREDAFSQRERAGFDVLGRTVGFVFHAARSRALLFADEVVELEFALRTSESMFGNAAPALDCDLELAGYVASGESWILYVEVHDVDPQEVADYAAEDPIVERARVINGTDAGGRLEVVVGQSDLLETVSAAGATVRSATATPSSARLVVEAPIGADVRDVVEIVTREYTGADLLARREREREISAPTRPDGILGELTDRQRSVLQAAYRAGYFDWPRESTAEEVADSLDVAPATLHGHLRKAEKAVFAALYGET